MSSSSHLRNATSSIPTLRVVGLMSGTSLDGCDVVLTEISAGDKGRERERVTGPGLQLRTLAFVTHPMPCSLRSRIVAQLGAAERERERERKTGREGESESDRDRGRDRDSLCRMSELSRLDAALGHWFAEAVQALLTHCVSEGIIASEADVDLIGSHGQTMWHDVGAETDRDIREKMTWQLGDGSFIAALTGITTVCDFRTADVALGGQGAPLIPFFDQIMYGGSYETVALQNIGGIGNVTLLPVKGSTEKPLGFDTGPGNMIIDRFVERFTNGEKHFDDDGQLAAQGCVCEELLGQWLSHIFFKQLPPKSTGREQFGHAYADEQWDIAMLKGLSGCDAIATATAFTARSIALALKQVHESGGCFPDKIIVAGGGAHNSVLLNMIAQLVSPARVVRAGDGEGEQKILSDAKEAIAFAVFAYQSVCGRSNHLPVTTGASQEIILGKICPGRNFQQLLFNPLPRHYKTISAVSLTETRLTASQNIDQMKAEDVIELMNMEDVHLTQVVASQRKTIALVAEKIADTIASGGRIFYVGAGTSGRLGVLDASEIPPTFSAPKEWFQGIIAGGDVALRNAVEGAEDNSDQGDKDITARNVCSDDVIIGIASSGTTPYVHGALQAGNRNNCYTVLITCNPIPQDALWNYINTIIPAVVGPEVLTGSTRMKAGTATKLILNQLSTVAMILSGKTFGNLMVDLRMSNEKLKNRAIRILRTVAPELEEEDAKALLQNADGRVKLAIAMIMTGHTKDRAEQILVECGGRLGNVLSTHT